MFWCNNLTVFVQKTNPQFLMSISDNQRRNWTMAMVYGSPSKTLRHNLWNELGKVKCGKKDHWITMGDFNIVTCMDEVNNSKNYVEQ